MKNCNIGKHRSLRNTVSGVMEQIYYSIKSGQSVSTNTINHLCRLLRCRVEDVIEYIDEEE